MHHFQILALVYYIISGAMELIQISLGKLGLTVHKTVLLWGKIFLLWIELCNS